MKTNERCTSKFRRAMRCQLPIGHAGVHEHTQKNGKNTTWDHEPRLLPA